MDYKVIFVALLLVLSGCSALNPQQNETATPTEPTETPTPTETKTSTTPAKDTLGVENGYRAQQSLDINASDGYTKEEINAVKSRSMARIELVRGLEFKENVQVNFVSRSEFSLPQPPKQYAVRQNVKYEASFVIPENKDAVTVTNELRQSGVTGYYSSGQDKLVLIVKGDTSEIESISPSTLAHELTHALQDQHKLSLPHTHNPDTKLAHTSFIEGDAEVVTSSYMSKCETGDWDCIDQPTTSAGSKISDKQYYALLVFPYQEGPSFVQTMKADCWCNINDMYKNLPQSTEMVIHPDKYPSDTPTTVTLPKPASKSDSIKVRTHSMTVGEATMAMMMAGPEFEETGYKGGNPIVTEKSFIAPEGGLNYNFKATEGWEGDSLAGYTVNGNDAYIWKIQWESKEDRKQFKSAYIKLIKYYNAEKIGTNTWHIKDKQFKDYVYIDTSGKTVTIYNAENKSDLQTLKENSE